MVKRTKRETTLERIAVDTDELAALLSCGTSSARKVGEAAGAKIKLGGRVLWNLRKIREHIDKETGIA